MATEKDKKKATQEGVSQARQSNSSSAQTSKTDQSLIDAAIDQRKDTSAKDPTAHQRILRPPHEGGSNVENTVISDGQQLQYERELRGWAQKELAEKLGITVPEVQKWETNRSTIDFASRQKLTELLGNDFYLSSEVKATPDGTALQVRIVQRLPAAQDFTTIISALTRLHTQFWLIQQGSLADLSEFARTQDRRYFEKANLIIENLASNSPALITFLTDPSTVTTAVASGVTLALALQKVTEALVQGWNKIVEAKIETRKKGAEQRNTEAEEKRKQIEEGVATMTKVIDALHPGADPQTRGMMLQTILPDYVECLNGKGRKLDLSPLVVCP